MNTLRKNKKTRLPPRDRQEQRDEYWQSKGGVALCEDCGAWLYKKRWHHFSEEYPDVPRGKIRFVECPACLMIKRRVFEGELMIENVPARNREELERLIQAYGRRAEVRDPEDRVISVKQTDGSYRVTTTENQMAVRLGKMVKNVFNKATIDISHSTEPHEVARVRMHFE